MKSSFVYIWCLLLSLLLTTARGLESDGVPVVSSKSPTLREVVKARLSVSPEQFLRSFVLDADFTRSIFNKNGDKNVRIGEWTDESEVAGQQKQQQRQVVSATRDLEYAHPVKSRFLGMPTHARTFKRQRYQYDPESGLLDVSEELRFEGIPFSDFFAVHNEWTVRPVTQAAQQGHEEGGEEFDNDDLLQQQKQQQQQAEIRSDVTIKLGVVFSKRTVLRGKIERSTFAEQGEALQDWVSAARARVAGGLATLTTTVPATTITTTTTATAVIINAAISGAAAVATSAVPEEKKTTGSAGEVAGDDACRQTESEIAIKMLHTTTNMPPVSPFQFPPMCVSKPPDSSSPTDITAEEPIGDNAAVGDHTAVDVGDSMGIEVGDDCSGCDGGVKKEAKQHEPPATRETNNVKNSMEKIDWARLFLGRQFRGPYWARSQRRAARRTL